MEHTKRVTMPRDIAEATEILSGVEALLTATQWERAAIVATFVRLSDTAGRPPGSPEMVNGDHFSTHAFADLGIAGLRSHNTVRLYATRWLDAVGYHPEPGQDIELPSDPWEPTRTGTDGRSSAEGARRTIAEIATAHPDVIAEAVREMPAPTRRNIERAAAEAEADEIAAEKRRARDRRPVSSPLDTAADRLDLFDALARLRAVIRDLAGLPKPDVAALPIAHERLGAAIEHLDLLRTVWADDRGAVTDEALADLLNEEA